MADGENETKKPFSKLSFLFVIHEFDIDWEVVSHRDCWGNVYPPTARDAYRGLIQSSVMRWKGRNITRATDYKWQRQPNAPGILVPSTDDGSGEIQPYKTFSVFECGWELPVCVVANDASLGHTRITVDWDNPERRWSWLHFLHPNDPRLRGISQAVTIFGRDNKLGGRHYVAGNHASWIPSLVPQAYSTSPNHRLESKGLGGELPIVLGLMAFHKRSIYSTDSIFLGEDENQSPLWSRGRWTGGVPEGRPERNEDNPRGFLVQVFLDNVNNPVDSTVEEIRRFEWESAIVLEA